MARQITVNLDRSSILEGQSGGVKLLPRAGVEPARPFGQQILRPVMAALGSLQTIEPVFTGLAVIKVSLQLAQY